MSDKISDFQTKQVERRKSKHRIKQCNRCLEDSPPGSKVCAHCGKAFKATGIAKIIKKLKRFFAMAGEKKLSTGDPATGKKKRR